MKINFLVRCHKHLNSPTENVLIGRMSKQGDIILYALEEAGQRDRAAKVMDSKSIGLCPQGFESPRCRI